jgi:transposase-like protein
MSSGARSPEELKAEIEQTREQLGETVEALAERTDVRAQLRSQRERARERAGQLAAEARQAMPASASQGAAQLAEAVRRRPLPFLLGGLAAGVLAGRALAR